MSQMLRTLVLSACGHLANFLKQHYVMSVLDYLTLCFPAFVALSAFAGGEIAMELFD
jgi:hypothetical protein